jgi:hypothetical protein
LEKEREGISLGYKDNVVERFDQRATQQWIRDQGNLEKEKGRMKRRRKRKAIEAKGRLCRETRGSGRGV